MSKHARLDHFKPGESMELTYSSGSGEVEITGEPAPALPGYVSARWVTGPHRGTSCVVYAGECDCAEL